MSETWWGLLLPVVLPVVLAAVVAMPATAQEVPAPIPEEAAPAAEGEASSESTEQGPADDPPPPSTDAERRRALQQEILVLLGQARGVLEQARPRAEASPEIAALVTEVERLVAAGESSLAISSLQRLESLRDQLLEAPVELYAALAAPVAQPVADEEAEEAGEAGTPEPPAGAVTPPVAVPAPAEPPVATPRGATPPAPLRRAAERFLAGRYREAVTGLEGASFDEPRAAAHAALLRAASRFALYQLAGGEDDALLAAARADVETCRASAPGLEPDPLVFSPRFLRFYRR